jgi:hypothetical protein
MVWNAAPCMQRYHDSEDNDFTLATAEIAAVRSRLLFIRSALFAEMFIVSFPLPVLYYFSALLAQLKLQCILSHNINPSRTFVAEVVYILYTRLLL